jgi:nucleotide-binding universal stress UspA family protein
MLPVKTILHPTDFSQLSSYAFGLACSLARDYGARLVVLHVAHRPMPPYIEGIYPPLLPETDEELRAKLDQVQGPDPAVPVERRLAEGNVVGEILRVAKETGCELIVMGTHGRTGLGRLLLGSVAEQVLRRASCPVMMAKAPLPQSGSAGEPDVAKT